MPKTFFEFILKHKSYKLFRLYFYDGQRLFYRLFMWRHVSIVFPGLMIRRPTGVVSTDYYTLRDRTCNDHRVLLITLY